MTVYKDSQEASGFTIFWLDALFIESSVISERDASDVTALSQLVSLHLGLPPSVG